MDRDYSDVVTEVIQLLSDPADACSASEDLLELWVSNKELFLAKAKLSSLRET